MKRALGASTLSITIGAIPVFLVGALAVFIRDELNFTEFRLGLLASGYYALSALTSVPGGRVAERLGGPRATALAAVLSGSAMFSVALFARNWWLLMGCMVLAGVGNGIALPASNLLLSRGMSLQRQGVAFGVKQSSGPIATLFAGASVPLLGLTIGWRWAFVLVGMAAVPLILLGRSNQKLVSQSVPERGSIRTGPLVMLALGAACAVIGGSSLAAFYVESGVDAGMSAGVVGGLLAAGSVVGIAARVSWGWVGDRFPELHIPLLGAMMLVGAAGYLALGLRRWAHHVGLGHCHHVFNRLGLACLFMFAVVTRSQGAPGAATGIIGTGLYSGGIVGPLVFGALVERYGYEVAWGYVASFVSLGSVLVYSGGRRLERGPQSSHPASVVSVGNGR